MRRVDTAERRSRLGIRHRLASPADDAVAATRSLVALHSSDPTTVFLSLRARVPGFRTEDLERLLYEDRALARFYGMRRTLWIVDREMVPVVHNSSTKDLGEKERRRSRRILEEGGITDDGDSWLERVEEIALEQMAVEKEILARDLTRAIPDLQDKIEYRNKAGRLVATTGLTTRLLNQLALESRVIRGRPAGSWISSQYRWSRTEDWLGEPIADMPVDEASARLLRAWLYGFGPATENDIRWWTGWPVSQVRRAIADVAAVPVELAQGPGWLLPDDVEPVDPPERWVALLPSLDPTTMGWKERDWYTGGHEARLFDRNGNAGPTVWANGRVVGGWAQRQDGGIAHALLEPVDPEIEDMIDHQLHELEEWFGGTTITPRFRTDLEKELAR